AIRIGMVHDQTESGAIAHHRRPLQHLEIAVGIAEGSNRTSADMLVYADRLSRPVVDEVDLRQTKQGWRAVAHLEPCLDRRANDLVGESAVALLAPGPHELDASS